MVTMEKAMANLKQRDRARETYLREKENYVDGLEKDLVSYKAHAEDLQ